MNYLREMWARFVKWLDWSRDEFKDDNDRGMW